MTLSQLTDLVAALPEIWREIVVKHHADGAWVPYESVDPETAKRPCARNGRRFPLRQRLRPSATIRRKQASRGAFRLHPNPRAAHFSGTVSAYRLLVGELPFGCASISSCEVSRSSLSAADGTPRCFQTVSDAAQKARDARKLDDAERARRDLRCLRR